MKKFKFFTRLLCVVLVFVLMASFSLHLNALPVLESTDSISFFDSETASILINLYADSDTNFSISNTRPLKDSDGDNAYTVVELSPYGYAIFNNSNTLLVEACFQEGVTSPIPMNNNVNYYYVGPSSFAIKQGVNFVSADDGTLISTQSIQAVSEFEERISVINAQQLNANSLQPQVAVPPISQPITKSVAPSYFSNLNAFGDNILGTCTVISAAMLFGYYEHNIHNGYIADNYTTSASYMSSAGTTEAFHQLLCDYVYTDQEPGGIDPNRATLRLNAYLQSRSLPVSFEYVYPGTVRNTQIKVVELINNNHPATAGFYEELGGDMNHSVLVYGYSYIPATTIRATTDEINYDTLLFRVHYGWLNELDKRDVLLSSSWFKRCGYIIDCTETGTHYNAVDDYTGNNYHSGQYHYFEIRTACCSCGRADSYDWEMRLCNGQYDLEIN